MDTDFTELIQCLKKENADLHEKYTELYQDYMVCLEQNKNYKEQLNKLAPSPYTATINKLKTTFSLSPPGLPPSPSPPIFPPGLPVPPMLPVHNEKVESIPPKLVLPSSYSSVSIESADSLTPDGDDDDKNYLTLSPEIKPVKEPTIDTKSTTEKRFKTSICKHWEKYKEYKEWKENETTYEIMATNNKNKQFYLNSFRSGNVPIECKYGDSCRYAHGVDKLDCAYCKKNGHTLIKCPELEGRNRFSEKCQLILPQFAAKGAGDKPDWRQKS